MTQPVIRVSNLKNYLGGSWVHDGLDFTVDRGEVVAIVGGSGAGKTTLLRCILKLLEPTSGRIEIFGENIINCSSSVIKKVRERWGMMFQQGALFSSLTVLDNVMFPLQEFTKLNALLCRDIALLKIALVGLSLDSADKFPAELSGGMLKRAAMARAISMDPELLFLDEPTAGLDPHGAGALDDLVLHLRNALGLTIVMVTHDLDTLWRVPDRVAFLGEGRVLACEPMADLAKNTHPMIKDYFSGPRGQIKR